MMDQDRITQYIHSLDQGHGAFCDQIAKTARTGRVPIIRKETANFLQAMVAAKQPKRILEVGTAVGYSALLMAQVMPEGSDLLAVPPQVFVVLLCQLSPLEEQTFLGSAPGLTSEEVDQSGQNACGHGQRGTLPQKEARQAVLEARRKSLNLLNLFPE